MFLFFFVIFLPLLEIAGFIAVGGRLGIGLTLLWVILDVVAGMTLLATLGGTTLKRARSSVESDIYPFEEMFDGFCIIAGAMLLIFPGFVSDLLALPLLLAPVRGWIFRQIKEQHGAFYDDLSRRSQGFTHWYYEERHDGRIVKTIEGEARNVDDTLPPPQP